MMKMSSVNKKILNTLLAVDIGVILFCALTGHRNWLYTTQIGFFSSALVMIASMASYRKMVEKRVAETVTVSDEERDELDKIDDPHGLYESGDAARQESIKIDESAEASDEADIAKKRTPFEIIKDTRAFWSYYRAGAYLLLVIGFFYLNRHNYLHIPSYLFALALPPVIVVTLLVRANRQPSQEY